MCDYSLMEVENRLARENDDLVVHRFERGSIGLTDYEPPTVAAKDHKDAGRPIWAALKNLFFRSDPAKHQSQAIAVCVPPGARLLVADMPKDIQAQYKVGPIEEVTFTQLNAEAHRYRDAIRLRNGAEILLQSLREGQRVRVLQLSLTEPEAAADDAPATVADNAGDRGSERSRLGIRRMDL
jgi:hypothetical protein